MGREEWFAGRLRELRTAKGWTRQQPADGSGVGLAAMRDIEQGVRVPGWGTVIALAAALEVSTDTFNRAPATEAAAVKPTGCLRKPETPAAEPPTRLPIGELRKRVEGEAAAGKAETPAGQQKKAKGGAK